MNARKFNNELEFLGVREERRFLLGPKVSWWSILFPGDTLILHSDKTAPFIRRMGFVTHPLSRRHVSSEMNCSVYQENNGLSGAFSVPSTR